MAILGRADPRPEAGNVAGSDYGDGLFLGGLVEDLAELSVELLGKLPISVPEQEPVPETAATEAEHAVTA